MEQARNNLPAAARIAARWIPPPAPWPVLLPAGISTRVGGVSSAPFATLNLGTRTGDDIDCLHTNLVRLERATGIPLGQAARVELEHGARVREAAGPGMQGSADALITRRAGLPLALTVADCFPVALGVPGRAAALLHCGWRSTAQGLVGAVMERLVGTGVVTPRDLWAWVGPGIGPCCFAVGLEVAARFPAHTRRSATGESEGASGTRYVDLPAYLRDELRRAGLSGERILSDGRCTACNPGLFFSHRGERGRTGRMLAWVMLADPPDPSA
jgi:polyphenol oxidase